MQSPNYDPTKPLPFPDIKKLKDKDSKDKDKSGVDNNNNDGSRPGSANTGISGSVAVANKQLGSELNTSRPRSMSLTAGKRGRSIYQSIYLYVFSFPSHSFYFLLPFLLLL